MAPYPELQLAVRECKDGDEGMNMVFVSYSDFRALAGSAAGQQDSVRVILEESHIFFVRISVEMNAEKGCIGLDSVQRSTMQICLNDRVRVRVWPGAGSREVTEPIKSVKLTVDLPSFSNKRPTFLAADKLVKTVRRCFADNVFQPKQHLLAVVDGTRLRLRVIGMEASDMDVAIAVCMSQHVRLGAFTPLQMLESAHLRRIVEQVLPTAHHRHFVLTRETTIDCQVQPNSPINLRKQVRTMFLENTPSASSSIASRSAALHTALNEADETNNGPPAMHGGQEVEEDRDQYTIEMKFGKQAGGKVVVDSVSLWGSNGSQLFPGDIIESMNGLSVVGGVAHVESLMPGPHGSFITFGVLRGGQRLFITLERNQRAKSTVERNTPAKSNGSPTSRYASHLDHTLMYTSPALRRQEPLSRTLNGSETLHRSANLHLSPSTPRRSVSLLGDDGRLDLNAALEDLTKENKRLRDALIAERSHSKELMHVIESERTRALLAEKVAGGLESQLEVLHHLMKEFQTDLQQQWLHEKELQYQLSQKQRQVCLLHEELAKVSDRLTQSPPTPESSQERESIERLEEMVETLLTLGEQESATLHNQLTRENDDLKSILTCLQRAEILQHSGDHIENHKKRASPMHTRQPGLSALSNSPYRIAMTPAKPQEEGKVRPMKGFLPTSFLSEALSSLRSSSPELEPLVADMSSFVRKEPPLTWEEAMSKLSSSRLQDTKSAMNTLNQAHRDPRHGRTTPYKYLSTTPTKEEDVQHKIGNSASRCTWEDAISGYSRLTSSNLSMIANRVDTPNVRKTGGVSARVSSPSFTLNGSDLEGAEHAPFGHEDQQDAARDLTAGEKSDNDDLQGKKDVPPVFEWERWEQERKPCSWAAQQAGIDEKAAGIVHKLLLKGKKLRQVSKNHKIAHINLTDKHIHDYIHYSTVFSLQHFGSKPRWALRYAQDELAPGHEPTSSASNSDRAIQQLVPSKAVEAQALGHATLSGAVEPLVELQSPDHRQREAEHDVSSPVAFLPGAEDSLSPVLIT